VFAAASGHRRMPNQILSRQSLKYRIVIGVAAGFFAVTGSALAEGLSDQDYLYLATVQHVDHTAAVLNISPLERARLHYLINDPRAVEDPAPRDKNVKNALDEFLAHQLWEKSHPGQLWDAPKR
jgi:hypothetical protein